MTELATRGTTNRNDRGSAAQRRKRRQWLLDNFGDGTTAMCAFGCDTVLTLANLYVDRHPIPGCQGGRYTKDNIRPSCGPCNSIHGGGIRRA